MKQIPFGAVMVWRLALPILCAFLSACGVGANFRPIPMTPEESTLVSRAQASDPHEAKDARRSFVEKHPEWSDSAKMAVARGEAVPEMTRVQVRAAWGPGELRQMAGGFIIDQTLRERWLYDRSPLLVMAYFLDERLVEARAFDLGTNAVPIARGEFGFVLPQRESGSSRYPGIELLKHAQRIQPKW